MIDPPIEQEPRQYCQGLWIPQAIWLQFYDRKLSSTEVLLLAFIATLVKPESSGCWASNEYLGKKFHKHPRSISRLVQRLIRLGLLKENGKKTVRTTNFRLLKTTWNDIKIKKQLHKNVNEQLHKNVNEQLHKNVKQSNKEESNKDTNVGKAHTNGILYSSSKNVKAANLIPKGGPAPPPNNNREMAFAIRLHAVAEKKLNMSIPWTPKDIGIWKNTLVGFMKNINYDYDRLAAAIAWYEENWEFTKIKFGHAKAFIGPTVFGWIEDSMGKNKPKDKGKPIHKMVHTMTGPDTGKWERELIGYEEKPEMEQYKNDYGETKWRVKSKD